MSAIGGVGPGGHLDPAAGPEAAGAGAEAPATGAGAAVGAGRAPWVFHSPRLDPWAFLRAVADRDPRVTRPGVADAAEAAPGVKTDVAELLERYDAAPAGRKPKIWELAAAYSRALSRRHPGLAAAAGGEKLDAEFTFALHAAASETIARGGTERARAAIERVEGRLSTSLLDWAVTGRDKRKAAAELRGLDGKEFFFALDELEARGAKVGWLFEGSYARLAEAKAADLARSMGLGGAAADALPYHLWMNRYRDGNG